MISTSRGASQVCLARKHQFKPKRRPLLYLTLKTSRGVLPGQGVPLCTAKRVEGGLEQLKLSNLMKLMVQRPRSPNLPMRAKRLESNSLERTFQHGSRKRRNSGENRGMIARDVHHLHRMRLLIQYPRNKSQHLALWKDTCAVRHRR